MNTVRIEYPTNWKTYRLLDSGNGEKLERFNGYTIRRPDPRILWTPFFPSIWDEADALYTMKQNETAWDIKTPPPGNWQLSYEDKTFILKPTDFKHVGIFPEQAVNWDWLSSVVNRPLSILNLFGYTGAATVVSAKKGARVTHVDSSKPAISWARENATLNTVPKDAIRWIEDDVISFVKREERRGNTYDAVIMDPPRFGRGTKGQVWKLSENLPKLLHFVNAILSKKPRFILLNVYTADLSSIAVHNLMQSTFGKLGGNITSGEIAIKEDQTNRLLPQGIVSRWKA